MAYYQYLKDGIGGMDPSREELKLRSIQRRTQRTSDLGVIQSVFLDMPKANDFCTRDPYHDGAEVFGSQKQKPNIAIGVDEKTYRLDTINFSWPHPMKRITRARAATLPTIVKEVKTSAEQVQSFPPIRTDVRCITVV